jgi:hypothetical protein
MVTINENLPVKSKYTFSYIINSLICISRLPISIMYYNYDYTEDELLLITKCRPDLIWPQYLLYYKDLKYLKILKNETLIKIFTKNYFK